MGLEQEITQENAYDAVLKAIVDFELQIPLNANAKGEVPSLHRSISYTSGPKRDDNQKVSLTDTSDSKAYTFSFSSTTRGRLITYNDESLKWKGILSFGYVQRLRGFGWQWQTKEGDVSLANDQTIDANLARHLCTALVDSRNTILAIESGAHTLQPPARVAKTSSRGSLIPPSQNPRAAKAVSENILPRQEEMSAPEPVSQVPAHVVESNPEQATGQVIQEKPQAKEEVISDPNRCSREEGLYFLIVLEEALRLENISHEPYNVFRFSFPHFKQHEARQSKELRLAIAALRAHYVTLPTSLRRDALTIEEKRALKYASVGKVGEASTDIGNLCQMLVGDSLYDRRNELHRAISPLLQVLLSWSRE